MRFRFGRRGLGVHRLALAVLIAGGMVGGGSAPISHGMFPWAGCGPAYSLSVNPSNGSAPLLVSFSLSGPVSGSTPIAWTFGDGDSLNGTGPDYAFAAHSYSGPGTFGASVTVDPANPIATCGATVVVYPGPLLVGFIASAYGGMAPLTVQFNGTASGGTGDYRSELWSFGDGTTGTGFNVTHTFTGSGSFLTLLTVADSDGVQGAYAKRIAVQSPLPTTESPVAGGPTLDLTGWAVLVGGMVVAVVAIAFAYRLWRHPAPSDRATGPSDSAPIGTIPHPGPESSAGPASEVGAPGARVGDSPATLPDPVATRPGPTSPPGVALRTSQRVITHIARQGLAPPPPLGVRSLTQAGIGEALGLEQSNLTRVLRRLELAGVVTRDLRHVPGIARRVRVYLLTPTGERIALGLIRHEREAHGSQGSATAGEGSGTG